MVNSDSVIFDWKLICQRIKWMKFLSGGDNFRMIFHFLSCKLQFTKGERLSKPSAFGFCALRDKVNGTQCPWVRGFTTQLETFTLMMQLLHLHTPTSIPALQEFVNSNSPPIPLSLPSKWPWVLHTYCVISKLDLESLHIEHVTNNAFSFSSCPCLSWTKQKFKD